MNGMFLARVMLLSSSGTATFNWTTFSWDGVSTTGSTTVDTSTAKTLATVSGLTKAQLDNTRAFVIYPTAGAVLYGEYGTADGLGGGTVGTTSPRALQNTEVWL